MSNLLVNTWKLYRRLHLHRIAHPLLKVAPQFAVDGVEAIKAQLRIHARKRLVPERELTDFNRATLQRLVDRRGAPSLGDYLEFGVFNGTSLVCMYRALEDLGLSHVRLFGFDSFEGLPHGEDGYWRAGSFKCDEAFTRSVLAAEGVPADRVTLVKGFFDATLTEGLLRRHCIRKASVIMIDCDLYASARQALNFCEPLIQEEAAILFDEYHELGTGNVGERRAFNEFLHTHCDLHVDDIGTYSRNAQGFLLSRAHVGQLPRGPAGRGARGETRQLQAT